MKRLALFLLLVCGLSVVNLSAKDSAPVFKAVEVKHFAQGDGVALSQDFVNSFYAGLCEDLLKTKVTDQLLEEGATIPAVDAADSAVVEGKFTEYKKGGGFSIGGLSLEIGVYRKSDHTLIKMLTPRVPIKPSPFNKDNKVGQISGERAAYEIKRALK